MAKVTIAISYEGQDNELGLSIVNGLEKVGKSLTQVIDQGSALVSAVKSSNILGEFVEYVKSELPYAMQVVESAQNPPAPAGDNPPAGIVTSGASTTAPEASSAEPKSEPQPQTGGSTGSAASATTAVPAAGA